MKIKKQKSIIIIILLLITSCAANMVLLKFSINNYRNLKRVQIDPGNLFYFTDENRKIIKEKKERIRIVLFGDSRISRWDPLPEISGCEFIKRGVPGETSSQALLRFENDIVSLNPDIVIIQTGVNDCNAIGVLPEHESLIKENCKNSIGTISNKLTKKSIRVVLLTIFPAGKAAPHRLLVWSEKTREAIDEINIYIRQKHSTHISIINCDNIFLDGKIMKKNFSLDMLHINTDGYSALNEHIQPYIEMIIKELNPGN